MTLLCPLHSLWRSLALRGQVTEEYLIRMPSQYGCKNRCVAIASSGRSPNGNHSHYLQSLADLGLPVNGSDGIFLQMAGKNGWTGDFAPMPEAW